MNSCSNYTGANLELPVENRAPTLNTEPKTNKQKPVIPAYSILNCGWQIGEKL